MDGSVGVWRMRVAQGKMRVTRVGLSRRLREVYGEFGAEDCATVLMRVDEAASVTHSAAVAAAATTAAVPTPALSAARRAACMSSSAGEECCRNEVVMLTRGRVACVLSVRVIPPPGSGSSGGDTVLSEECVDMTVLCAIRATHPLSSAGLFLSCPTSLLVPVLSLFVADKEGTVLLYSIQMGWRDAETWRDRGGGH